MSESAKNGKALEYEIAKQLLDGGAIGLVSTIAYQARDRPHFATRPLHIRFRFVEAANVIVQWMTIESGGAVLTVRRMEDDSGDVADLVVGGAGSRITRCSIKHNHHALKHPRPYSLAQACGFPKESPEDLQQRIAMERAAKSFRAAASAAGHSRYRDVPDGKERLYRDVIEACADSISRWEEKRGCAAPLFQFLVGSGFKKLIVSPEPGGAIELQDFSSLVSPAKVAARRTTDPERLELSFNNHWVIHCRLHTAATEISTGSSQLSLKFDVQRVHGSVPTKRLA